MGELVNLNKARKARAKTEAEKKAADNRLKFGMTKAEKKKLEGEKTRFARHVEGHRRETDDTTS